MQAFLNDVADQTVAMLSDRDTKTAEQIITNDDKLDELHKKTFELAQSADWSGTNQQLIDVVLIGRFMERLGDDVHRLRFRPVQGADPRRRHRHRLIFSCDLLFHLPFEKAASVPH